VTDVLGAVIRGLSFGSVYALLALGLVLTYRTTGVFNLAFGPQAFFSAALFYDTHTTHHWPILPALIFSVGVMAPIVGFVLDRGLFRFLRTASETAKLVSVLGLFVALPQMIFLWFGPNAKANGTGIIPGGSVAYSPIHNVFVSRDDLAIIITGLLVFVGLTAFLRYTALGLRMRAVVESARLTELAGVNADRASIASWMLSSALAGLAGVLLTPVFAGQIVYDNYETLVIAAIAAAVVGGLRSLPLAYAGALALGIVQQMLDRYLPTQSVFASGLRPALPFIVLFLVLIFSPAKLLRPAATDPLAGVDPPPPAPSHLERSDELTKMTRGFAVAFFLVVGYYIFFHANDSWVDLAVRATILSVIFLSITVITGFAGQISLCQASFAAIGACATGQLATRHGFSVIPAMLVGALIAAAVGALIALPALRLGGIFLSLATLAFAFFFQNVLVNFSWVGGGLLPIEAPRPLIGSIDLGSGKNNGDNAYLVFALIVLVLVSIAVIWVRSGTTGRYLDAMRGSEVAAASIGINRNRARIVAFALSAAIAGLGGGLFASYEGAANVGAHYVPELGVAWIVLVVTLGSRTVEGAINAAVGFVFFAAVVLPTWLPWLVNHVQPVYHMSALPAGLQPILFGLGALTYAKHPEGILEFQKRRSLARVQRTIDRVKRGKAGAPPSGTSGSVDPKIAAAAGSSA
jgi:branched-subunit amino acid ABC-type transport system permease component